MKLFGNSKEPANDDVFGTPSSNAFGVDPVDTPAKNVWGEPEPQKEAEAAPAMSLKMITLKKYPDDAKKVIDFVLEGHTVLMNAESLDAKDFVRWVDYTAGAVYVLGATLKRQGGTKTFVLAPKGVDVSSLAENE